MFSWTSRNSVAARPVRRAQPLDDVERAPEQPLDQRHLTLEHVDLAQVLGEGPRVRVPPAEHQLLERVDLRLDRLHRIQVGVDRAVEHLGQEVRVQPLLAGLARRLGLELGLERRQPCLLGAMNRDEEGRTGEDGELPGELLDRGTGALGIRVERAQDHEDVGVELLVLGQVLRVEAVLDRGGLEAVRPRDRLQLLGGGLHEVEPHQGGLARSSTRPDGHARQIRLAAAAAPNPLSMFTTVTPAAQELSMPSSAASPPNEAP